MIGVALVVFVAVFAAGLKDSFLGAIDRSVKSEFIIQATDVNSGGVLPAGAANEIRQADGVQTVAPIAFMSVKVNGGGVEYPSGVDPDTITKVYSFDWLPGSGDSDLGKLQGGGALVEKNYAKDHDVKIGTPLTLQSQEGQKQTVKAVGFYDDPQLFTGFIVSNETARKLTTDDQTGLILVKSKDGADETQVESAIKQSLSGFPNAKVQSNAEFKADLEDQVNQILYLLYGLLSLSVIISLFGIVNTLVLTIYERTREIGMLRAIGTTRSQLRTMIRYESAITSSIGGVLGILVGVFFGWVVTKGLEDEGISFSLPIGQIIVFLIVATIVGVIAAVWPAIRAGRLNVLDALHYE
jgi:putative ABC transport system permease protein